MKFPSGAMTRRLAQLGLALVAVAVVWIGIGWAIHLMVSDGDAGIGELGEIVMPQPPLAGDDAFAKLNSIAARIGERGVLSDEQRACLSDPEVHPSMLCVELLDSHAAVIAELDRWRAGDDGSGSDRYALARPPELGSHARTPLVLGVNAELPSLTAILTLGRLLGSRVPILAPKNGAAARQAWTALIEIAGYLHQNPSNMLIVMAADALTNSAAKLAIEHLGNTPGDIELAARLPSRELQLEGLVMGIGGEAAAARYFLDSEMRRGVGPFDTATPNSDSGGSLPGATTWALAELFLLYNHDHMLQMDARRWYGLQAHARGGRLGTAFAPAVPSYEEMGWIRFVHNPIGRILFTIAAPNMAQMMARVGVTVDRVAAAQVVVAARASHAESGTWPASESDLVPRWLASWPTSALSGEPLLWDPQARQLRSLGRDGRTPCEETACVVAY